MGCFNLLKKKGGGGQIFAYFKAMSILNYLTYIANYNNFPGL